MKNKTSKKLLLTVVSCLIGLGMIFVGQRSSLGAEPVSKGFAPALPYYQYHFPRDHGAHPAYQTEWWYFTGHLKTQTGRMFGYELTFFRVGLHPYDMPQSGKLSGWRGNEFYPAHFALTDIDGHTFFAKERFEREALQLAGAAQDHLNTHVDDWHVTMDAHETITLAAHADGHAIALTLHPQKKLVIHGQQGVSRKGSCLSCASHYYSYTRLATTGEVTLDRAMFPITGTSWMDHEFGSRQLAHGIVGWDWFAIILNDGREIMLYRLRDKNGHIIPESSGSLILRSGQLINLERDDATISSTGSWTSPDSKTTYPSGWNLTIPKAKLHLALHPVLPNQELWMSLGTPPYWEGATEVQDMNGVSVGRAYVELTGYSGSLGLF